MIKIDRQPDEVVLARVRWHGFDLVPPKVRKTPQGKEYLNARLRGVLFVKLEYIPGLQIVTATTSMQDKQYEQGETPYAQDIQETVGPLMKAYPLESEVSVKKVVIRYEDDVASKKWSTTYFEVVRDISDVPDFHKHLKVSLMELVKPDNTKESLNISAESKVKPEVKKPRKESTATQVVEEEAKA